MKIFHKLRWQLTLSYTIVTVCAFLVVILIVGGILLPRVFIPENILTPEGIIEVIQEQTGPLLSHLLSQTPVDTRLLGFLLNNTEGTITSDDILRIGSLRFFYRTTAAVRTIVIGADGTLLGKSDTVGTPSLNIGQPFDPKIYQGLEDPYLAALAGDTDASHLSSSFGDGKRFILAIPVFNETISKKNQPVGVAVVVLESLPTTDTIPGHLLSIAGTSLLILLVGIGIMGAIFGYLFSRRLDVRFNRISTITDLWSSGDFSRYIEDTIGDEITQITQHLNNMARQLQNLLRRQQEMAISEERNRLARDLHDSAKQQALAASFELGTALTLFDRDTEGTKKHLIEADGLVDSVRKELTNLVDELRPHPVDGQEFSGVLKEYAHDWSQRNGIALEIKIAGDVDIPVSTREVLFRIVQEALANIARHSGADQAELALASEANNLTMTIKDNGRGFDVSSSNNGMGLKSMQERAKAIGGRFIIESREGQGTQITVTLPTGD